MCTSHCVSNHLSAFQADVLHYSSVTTNLRLVLLMLVQGYARLAEYVWFGLLKKKKSCEAFAQIIPPHSQGYCDPIQLTEGANRGATSLADDFYWFYSSSEKNRERTALGTCKAHAMFIFFYEVNKVFIWLKVHQIALRKKRGKGLVAKLSIFHLICGFLNRT